MKKIRSTTLKITDNPGKILNECVVKELKKLSVLKFSIWGKFKQNKKITDIHSGWFSKLCHWGGFSERRGGIQFRKKLNGILCKRIFFSRIGWYITSGIFIRVGIEIYNIVSFLINVKFLQGSYETFSLFKQRTRN